MDGTCEWNENTKKCQSRTDVYSLCSENLDENDCSRSLLGCAWVNNKCVSYHYCGLLSSYVCKNIYRDDTCEWNENTKKCQSRGDLCSLCSDNLDENDCNRCYVGCVWVNNKCVTAQKSKKLIRNLIDDEITTKYKCSFNFPNIRENKNFDLTFIDKNNNKASILLSLISSDSSNETGDENEFIIYRSSGSFLKNSLFVSLILFLLLFIIKN